MWRPQGSMSKEDHSKTRWLSQCLSCIKQLGSSQVVLFVEIVWNLKGWFTRWFALNTWEANLFMLEKSAAGSLMFCKWCPYRIEERKKKYHLLWGENEWWSCTLKKSLRRCIHRFLSGIHIETSPHWSCFIEPSRLRRCSESYRHKKRAPNSNTHRWIIEDSSPHLTDHIWPPHRCQHCMKLKRVWRWERQSIIDHRESSRIIQSNQSKAPNITQPKPNVFWSLQPSLSLLGEKLRWWRRGPTKRKVFASSGKSVWRSLEGSKVGMNKIMEQHRSKESQILNISSCF